jgi:cytochrome c nitrite reductase small subunit
MEQSEATTAAKSRINWGVLCSVTIAVLVGASLGVGVFTFGYAKGASYLTNRPEACANCHVMKEHLDAWVKSSHGRFATCNDCHAPHDLLGKYFCRGRNGMFHSWAFTTGLFPDQIQITKYNRQVVENACRYCHAPITHQIDPLPTSAGTVETISCLHCHSTVGHDT